MNEAKQKEMSNTFGEKRHRISDVNRKRESALLISLFRIIDINNDYS